MLSAEWRQFWFGPNVLINMYICMCVYLCVYVDLFRKYSFRVLGHNN